MKGKTGEQAVARTARAYGLSAERTAPMQAGSSAHDDVLIGGVGFEVKRCEELRMSVWLAKSDHIIFRRNREKWKVVLPLSEYLTLRSVLDA
jgi:hypothetical protein